MKENKMGTKPVPSLLFSMALPLMISLLVQSLYNIVDSIFVAKLSETALTATSLAYPVQMLMIALAVGTSVGVNALLSRLLGQRKFEEIGYAATTGFVLAVLTALVFILAGLFFIHPITALLARNSSAADLCETYLHICMIFCAGTFIETMAQRFLQASGKTVLSMVSLIVGAVTNIILDPIMIFGLFGFPQLGIAGAAIATVIGQWLGAVTALLLNRFLNPEIQMKWRGFRLKGKNVLAIYQVGLPTIITQALQSVMTFSMNGVLIGYSSSAVAFFGVYYRLQNFLFMPIHGLGQATIPIIGYNYGAKKGLRIRETIRVTILSCGAFALLATVIFETMPARLLGLFSAGEEMLAIDVPAIRIIAVTYVFAASTMVIGYMCSALRNAVINMIATSLRLFILLIPVSWYFLNHFGIGKTWFAFWIAEAAAFIYSVIFLRKEYAKKVAPICGYEG